MKALTICQPYAHLICLPESHPDHKRVENRTWPTRYRGPLLIHAGKSRSWLSLDEGELFDEEYDIRVADMRFGAVVAQCQLVDCLQIDRIKRGELNDKHPWLRAHQHSEGHGAGCSLMCSRYRRRFRTADCRGLWEMPDIEFSAAMERWPQASP